MNDNQGWKVRTLIIGAVIGTLVGLGAAYLVVQRAEVEGERPQLSTGEGVKLGLGVLGVLRQIADLGLEKR